MEIGGGSVRVPGSVEAFRSELRLRPGEAIRASRAPVAGAVLVLVLACWFAAGRAPAAGGPELFTQFCPSGSEAGQCNAPRGLAVDRHSGHVFLGDSFNRRVAEFTAWGEFVRAWGWNVVASGPDDDTIAPVNEFEVCVPAQDVCQAGTQGTAGVGQFSSPQGIAVDSGGNVYVLDPPARRVQKFSPTGQFLLMFGGAVNKTTGANVCIKADFEAGNVCGAGTTGSVAGQFGAVQAVGDYIDVDPADHVYVGDVGRIQRFDTGGAVEPAAQITIAGESVNSLATDSTGNLYVTYINSSNNNKANVRKLSPTGTPLSEFTVANPRAVAVAPSGDVYAFNKASKEILQFQPGGSLVASFGEGLNEGSSGLTTSSACLSGGAVNLYFSNFSPSSINMYGPRPSNPPCPPPAIRPTIAVEYAVAVDTTSAVVEAEVNPRFQPTRYYVEYGTVDCAIGPCSQQPAAPGALLGSDGNAPFPTAGVPLEGLEPGAVYHYRFVAANASGTSVGSDRTFKTYLPGGFSLPDRRGFEMVSPPDKSSGEVAVPGNEAGIVDPKLSVRPLQGATDGESIAYPSLAAFGEAQSAPAASTYLSRRTPAGWSTANITPPDQQGYLADPFQGFSADLGHAAIAQKEPVLAPGAQEGFENLYLRNNATNAIEALTTATPRGPDTIPTRYCVAFAGASDDFKRVFLAARGALTADAPEAAGVSLYEWSAGQLKLVSVLPDDKPAQPSDGTGFGAGPGCRGLNERTIDGAISADGTRVFWTYQPSSGQAQLLARLDGAETIQLDAAAGGAGPSGGGMFWAAAADGSEVFFTSPGLLTPDASGPGPSSLGDLYRYDLEARTLTDITPDPTPGSDPPSVLGVLGASASGDAVYFAANGVLAAGAEAGKPNLYLWRAGAGLRFIATLSPSDSSLPHPPSLSRLGDDYSSWAQKPGAQTARVTPDGRYLAFLSVAPLTGYDNVGQDGGGPVGQVYLYDASTKDLVCASCNPSGARPLGASELPVWITPFQQPRYLTDDGGRLFFQSADALSLSDSNGKRDVYEFERVGSGSCNAGSVAFVPVSQGCVFPISSGSSGDDSFFLDASDGADDVFLSTRQRLVLSDPDERFDVYDARVDGGFAAVPPPPPCQGEACRPADQAPGEVAPGSSGFVGEGNVRTAPHRRACGKHRHRVRRAGKARCVKKKSAHHRASRDRRAGR
jgi:hypothetical protein